MADLIDRQAALDALAKQMPKTYTPDGSHPADEEIYKIQEIYVDCIESIEILPAVQPEPCEDAISRRAAIELCDWYDNPSLHDDLEKLPPAQPEPHWISCSERLPYAEYGESDNVLATCGYRGVEDGSIRWIKTLYFNGGNWCYPTGETYLEKVYAWMPLPAPYKGGDSD